MRNYFIMKIFYLVFCQIYLASCARILGIFTFPGYSQYSLGESLLTELAGRGHEVTMIAPYTPKTPVPNYKTILVKEILDKAADINLFEDHYISQWIRVKSIHHLGALVTQHTLNHKNVRQLLASNATFDLVIMELFLNEAISGFAHHFNAPLIYLSSMGPSFLSDHVIGNPIIPSISPHILSTFSQQMSFGERLENFLMTIYIYLYKTYIALPLQKSYMKKYFANDYQFDEIVYNASLLFSNAHLTTTGNLPIVDGIVEIGGFHVEPKALPNDLQKYLDEATNGAILFSMGTNLNSTNISPDKLNAIVNVFKRLKQTVLWKFEDFLDNKPDNLLISKWLPQKDILAHPNVRLFITHGGLLSVTESVYNGVPMVGIPIFGDQPMNIAKACMNGLALKLEYNEITEEIFEKTITEVLNNPKYRENSQKFSRIFKDQMVKPMDKAVYWVEYVLRHNGATHLRSHILNLKWYHVYSVDVLLLIVIIFSIAYQIIKITIRTCKRPSKTSQKKKIKSKVK